MAFVLWLILIALAISNAQRAAYLTWIHYLDQTFPSGIVSAFIKGFVFDIAATFYLFAFLMLLLVALPGSWLNKGFSRGLLLAAALLPLYLVCTTAACEFFFFEEFHARFNFIAVDYLVYTHEIIRNIVESYTLPVVILTFSLPAILLWIFLRRRIRVLEFNGARFRAATGALALILGITATITQESRLLADAAYWPRELSKNSLFTLFSAYNHNSINFTEFYTSLSPATATQLTEEWLGGPLEREIKIAGPEKRWNVVLVAMESMSAQYLAHFGDQRALTTNLDRLSDEGLSFTHLYATGTRTVRGLEALMLSLPPTPGQSILRRPNSDHLFNIGTVFRDRGYKTQFIYGGYAVFDNMREWFEGNGFEVVDRSAFPSREIQFGNAWGVCDEDLFGQVLKQQEALAASGTPFMQVVLTTSNHRPYTFPDGRIDLPSHSGREGAIKYSDYSIGRFIAQAKTKPWFDNTVFVFIADHDASVAGGTDIPVKDYLIPAIFYNPKLIPAGKIEKLAAQIDIAPTILGLLDFSYRTKFFGQDLNRHPGGRALLGTYQKVALLEPGSLSILAPGRSVEVQRLDDKFALQRSSVTVSPDGTGLSPSARRAIAIYQTASDLFARGLLKHADGSAKPNP